MSSKNLNCSDCESMHGMEETPQAQCSTSASAGITDADDSGALDQVTPLGQAVIQFLQQKRHGAKLADIVKHVRTDRRVRDEKNVEKKMPEVFTEGVASGFLERKHSSYCSKVVSEAAVARTGNKVRRRRPRKCACEHRRHCCDLPLKRRGRRNT